MSDISNVSFTVKELLMDLKADVRAIDSKLDQKADRERVHGLASEISAINLLLASLTVELKEVGAMKAAVTSLTAWRNRTVGALTVIGLFTGALSGHVLHFF